MPVHFDTKSNKYIVTFWYGMAHLRDSAPVETLHRKSIVVMGKRHHYGKHYMAWSWPSGVRMIDWDRPFDGRIGA